MILSTLRLERNLDGSGDRTPNGVPTPQRLVAYKNMSLYGVKSDQKKKENGK